MSNVKRIRPLTELSAGDTATVARVKLPEPEANRLQDLGVRCGVAVRVQQNDRKMPLLVAVGDGRLAVNADSARGIYVF